MQMHARGKLWLVVGLSLIGAGGGCSLPANEMTPRFAVRCEDGRDLTDVAEITRFRVTGLDQNQPEDVWLVRGEISSTSANKMRTGQPPEVLSRARIPLVGWREGSEFVLAPAARLERGQRYGFVAARAGVLAQFFVSEEPIVALERQGEGSVRGGTGSSIAQPRACN